MPGIPNKASNIVLYLPFFISTSNVILLCSSDVISALGLYVSFIPLTTWGACAFLAPPDAVGLLLFDALLGTKGLLAIDIPA